MPDRPAQLLVVAKEPVPGRVKTRLCPPLSPAQAADVARAALVDTLAAVSGCRVDHRVVALDGRPGSWLPAGFAVVPQRSGDLAARLAGAWADAGRPGLQIGMDTPQVTPALLDGALDTLAAVGSSGGRRAVLGLATDGGWWALGMDPVDPAVFAGVPMSTDGTGEAQRRALEARGYTVELLPELRDIDHAEDLWAVAATIPGSATASVVDALVDRRDRMTA